MAPLTIILNKSRRYCTVFPSLFILDNTKLVSLESITLLCFLPSLSRLQCVSAVSTPYHWGPNKQMLLTTDLPFIPTWYLQILLLNENSIEIEKEIAVYESQTSIYLQIDLSIYFQVLRQLANISCICPRQQILGTNLAEKEENFTPFQTWNPTSPFILH